MDDRGIDDRAVRDLDALRFEMAMDLAEELLAQMVSLEEMAELQDRGLIGHRLPAEVDAHELTHGDRFIQGFFRPRIGEVEPLLEEIDAQHAFKSHGRPAVISLRIMGRDHRTEVVPGHHFLHVREEFLPTGGFAIGLEGAGG